jgi:hypothetical protein
MASGSAAVCAPRETTVQAASLVEMLQTQEKVLLDGVVIEGDVDLSSLGAVDVPLIITNSTITGRLMAQFTVFEGAIDWSGTCFESPVDIHGSLFREDVQWLAITVEQSFDAGTARFARRMDATGAVFNDTANFRASVFDRAAVLEQTVFNRDATFNRSNFGEQANFIRARFEQRAAFEDVSAAGGDFSRGIFRGVAQFRRFSTPNTLNLLNGEFADKLILDEVSAKELNLDKATLLGGDLAMGEMHVEELTMDLQYVDRIQDVEDQKQVLDVIEDTARGGGELELANNAAFQRYVLENEGRGWLEHQAYFVFGEQLAGYLVRPLRPLFAMLALVILGVMARTVIKFGENERRFDVAPASGPAEYETNNQFWPAFGNAIGDSVSAAIVPKRPTVTTVAKWTTAVAVAALLIEWISFRLLNAAFVIALANAVPGVKDVVDGILKL